MLMGMVLHVTVLAIVGYLLLFTATKTEGVVALIGRLLGLWIFLLAILSVAAVATAPMFGGRPFGMDWSQYYGHPPGWMHHHFHDGVDDRDYYGEGHMMPRGWMMEPVPAPVPDTQPTPAKPTPTKP